MDAGGVKALLSMLETAADDDTRREAVTALAMLAHYGACCYFCGIVCTSRNICKDLPFN